MAKRLSPQAYQALRDALAVVVWNKRPFESLIRDSFREDPELLAGLNFSLTKREVVDALVSRLAANERRYQDITLRVMMQVASTERFLNIEAIKDATDRELRLTEARRAVEHLAAVVKPY